MPLKNSNAVAAERRTDLASLFCMIGRHGPAVVLAVVAVVSVLAAFLIYRTVRGKRRKATAAAADGAGGRRAQDGGASVSRPEHEPNPERAFSSADSTDASDDASSDVKEEAHPIRSHPKVRLRRAAAANGQKPSPCSSAPRGRQVCKEDAQEDKNDVGNTDKNVPEKQNVQEVESLPCSLNSPVHFGPTSCTSANIDEALQDTGTTAEIDRVELCLETRATRQSKDKKFKAHSHSIDRSDWAREAEDEAVAPVRCGDDQVNSAACVKECEGTSLVPPAGLPLLSEPIKSDDNSLLGITSDQKAKNSRIAIFKESQHSQSAEKQDGISSSLDKDTRRNIPPPDSTSSEREIRPGRVVALAEEQQNSSTTNDDHFGCAPRGSVGTNPDARVVEPIMSEGISHPHSCQDFNDPVLNPSVSKINSLSFEQSELTKKGKDGASSPGVGADSGVSSMAASPDLQVPGSELDVAVNSVLLPAIGYDDKQPEEMSENNLCADDAASSVVNENAAGVEVEVQQSDNSQDPPSKSTDWAEWESAAANEDVFGREIDDSYHSALDQYIAHMAASLASSTSDLKKKPDMKDDAEGVQIREGSGVSARKKKETQAEKENEEDYEKSEISIMEATMDHNEWITDSNYQVLPWMNVCTSPLAAQGDQKPSEPAEADERGSSLRDVAYEDADAPSATRVEQKGDENSENGKKVVAVQPMPQNVSVTFSIHYTTHSPYQTVAVTGNQRELGNWKEFIPLQRAKDGQWSTVVSLPAESHVEWKFVLLDKGEVCRWEECGNRLLDTGFGDDVTVHKWWGLL